MIQLGRAGVTVVVWTHPNFSGDAIVVAQRADRNLTFAVPFASLASGDFRVPLDIKLTERELRIATSIAVEHLVHRR